MITEKQKTKKISARLIADLILLLVPCVLIAVFLICRTNIQFAESIIGSFSYPVRRGLGGITSLVTFSVTEVLIVLVILFGLFYIIYSIITVAKSSRKVRTALKRAFVLLLILLYILSAYCYIFGIDYYGKTFSEKSGIIADGFTKEELILVTSAFLNTANLLSDRVQRDENGSFSEDMHTYFAASENVYNTMLQQFEFLDGTYHMPKKMVFSKTMSHMGFTGMYFPFTGESNINVDCPGCIIPSTIAHELSHQLGITSEQEANFLGILACVSSDSTVYQYSGCLLGSIYLMNELYKVDKDAWRQLRNSFTPELENDWLSNNAYWASMESGVTETSQAVYNSYLKSNGQDLGILSYDACVNLLVEYYSAQLK